MPFNGDIQALPFQLQSAKKIRKVASLKRIATHETKSWFFGTSASREYGGGDKVTQSKNGWTASRKAVWP